MSRLARSTEELSLLHLHSSDLEKIPSFIKIIGKGINRSILNEPAYFVTS